MPTNEEIRVMIARLDNAHNNPGVFGLTNEAAAMLSALLAEREWRPIAEYDKDKCPAPVLTLRGKYMQSVAEMIFNFNSNKWVWCCVDGVELLHVTDWRPLPAPPENDHA